MIELRPLLADVDLSAGKRQMDRVTRTSDELRAVPCSTRRRQGLWAVNPETACQRPGCPGNQRAVADQDDVRGAADGTVGWLFACQLEALASV